MSVAPGIYLICSSSGFARSLICRICVVLQQLSSHICLAKLILSCCFARDWSAARAKQQERINFANQMCEENCWRTKQMLFFFNLQIRLFNDWRCERGHFPITRPQPTATHCKKSCLKIGNAICLVFKQLCWHICLTKLILYCCFAPAALARPPKGVKHQERINFAKQMCEKSCWRTTQILQITIFCNVTDVMDACSNEGFRFVK